MRVLQVIPEFGLAGAERMVENLSLTLKEMGHEVMVISLYDYHSAITENLKSKNINLVFLNKKKGLDLTIIPVLSKVIKEFNPDVIHTHRYILFYTFLASRRIGLHIPIIHTVHNEAKKENGFLYRKINGILFKYANVYPVALTQIILDTVTKEYKKLNKNIPVILNGVNIDEIKTKDDYEIKEKFSVVHVGRFAEAKNHGVIINGFKEFLKTHPNAHLYLYGEGDRNATIKSIVNDLNIKDKVSFMGVVSDMKERYKDYDVFILPSIYEGMPMTIIEAMAAGMPIIASNVGGIPDIINDGNNGLLISPTTDDLKDSLQKIYDDSDLRKSLGLQARKDSHNYSSKKMAETYLNFYKRLRD